MNPKRPCLFAFSPVRFSCENWQVLTICIQALVEGFPFTDHFRLRDLDPKNEKALSLHRTQHLSCALVAVGIKPCKNIQRWWLLAEALDVWLCHELEIRLRLLCHRYAMARGDETEEDPIRYLSQ